MTAAAGVNPIVGRFQSSFFGQEHRGDSDKVIARLYGVSPHTVKHWRHGKGLPEWGTFARIAQRLGDAWAARVVAGEPPVMSLDEIRQARAHLAEMDRRFARLEATNEG